MAESIDSVIDWLARDGRRIAEGTELVTQLADRLAAIGLPLARISLNLRTLHPQVVATTYRWERDCGCAQQIDREHGIQFTATFLNSPLRALYEQGHGQRWRLVGPVANLEFPVLAELRDQGLTDYFTMALPFADGRLCGSHLGDRPARWLFRDRDHRHPSAARRAVLGARSAGVRRITATLLNTFLGRATGERVLAGQIKRGDHENIRAVLLLADLRGFTRLSDTMAREALIGLLDSYFECVVGSVHGQGGEVLKFIGDGLLAIFPIAGDARVAARAALTAARDAETAIDGLNRSRTAAGEVPLRFGLALHVGDVFYGNIGAPDRLDFTVIGPAVNLVARIEALNKPLDRTMLASAEFAAIAAEPLVPLGSQVLRGVREPQDVYAVPDRPAVGAAE